MAKVPERRRVDRAAVTGRLSGQAFANVEVRLLDLSPAGARIEHLSLLRPGMNCTLRFPGQNGTLALSIQIVWCAVVGQDQTPEGNRVLRYHSGVVFVGLAGKQQTALTRMLERHTSGSGPKAVS